MSVTQPVRFQRSRRLAVGLAALACSSFGSIGVAGAATVQETATAHTTASSAIASNWRAFFSSKTSAAKKISLLQNGQKFATIIKEQAHSPLSAGVSAKVLKVTLHSKTSASVRYTIDEDGTAALKNQTGTAVFQDGTWKVGDGSFCGLLGLEGSKPSACPKA